MKTEIKILISIVWIIFLIFAIDLSLDYIRQPNTITNLVGLVIITSIGYATYFLTKIIFKKNEKNN